MSDKSQRSSFAREKSHRSKSAAVNRVSSVKASPQKQTLSGPYEDKIVERSAIKQKPEIKIQRCASAYKVSSGNPFKTVKGVSSKASFIKPQATGSKSHLHVQIVDKRGPKLDAEKARCKTPTRVSNVTYPLDEELPFSYIQRGSHSNVKAGDVNSCYSIGTSNHALNLAKNIKALCKPNAGSGFHKK